jgi:ubiquinone/menaquinone biosynthesis C-methylase UbiE
MIHTGRQFASSQPLEDVSLLAAACEAHRRELRLMIQDLPVRATDRVLDAPCGDGFFAALFAEWMAPAGEVICLDISPECLEGVRKRARRMWYGASISTVQADLHDMPFEDNNFDFVWCAQSLMSLAKPSEPAVGRSTVMALQAMRRVLRPGGLIAVLEHDEMHRVLLPWPADLELALQQMVRGGFRRKHGNPEQLEAGRRLGKLLRKAGFEPIHRVTCATDRHWPLDEAEQAYLEKYLTWLRRLGGAKLAPDVHREFERLTDPGSPDFLLHQPDFEMTCLDIVRIGRKA